LVTDETVGTGLLGDQGEFTITTSAISEDTDDMVLEIEENYTHETFTYPLIPGPVNPRFVGKQYLGDAKHRIRVPWWPPRPELAQVNSVTFVDTQKLARRLCELMQSPAYPTVMTLFHESAGNVYRDYTAAQRMFEVLVQGRLPVDFPARVANEVHTFLWLNTKAKTTVDKLVAALERLLMKNIQVLENDSILLLLLKALGRALDYPITIHAVEDAAPDMAAACALLFIAGLMAKDNAKPTVSFGYLSFPEMQMRVFDTVHISIAR